jgi:Domain of unknown function (DUF4350)
LPIQLSAGDRKLFLIAGAVFLLLVIATLILAKGTDSTEQIPTSYSVDSGGAKAAYLLLKASGYRVERWEQSPSELPEAADATLILADPSNAPSTEERRHLKQFVEKGGTIIATGPFAALLLPESRIVSDPLPGMTWKKLTALSPSHITRAATEITLAPQAYWTSGSFALPLYGDGDKWRVVQYRFGKGEVLWWASATPLTNAGLKEPGNMEFFLACIGGKPATRILWDEYFHGYRHSLTAAIQNSPVKWIFFQFALLALAVLLTYSRRSGPIRVPIGEIRLSPLEFVRTLGALYRQANAGSVAVDICYRRFRYWLTRHLVIAGNTPVDELERAIRDRWNFQDPGFKATLRECESAPFDNTLKPQAALRLVRSLDEYAAKLKLFSKSATRKY